MMTLPDYLVSFKGRHWQPGVLDCSVFMADWVRQVTGIDPIADVRGTYSTAEGFERILAREGGFIAACGARLTRAGYVETDTPHSGDIAAVLAPSPAGIAPTGAICVSPTLRAVVTSDKGVVISRIPTLRTWRHG